VFTICPPARGSSRLRNQSVKIQATPRTAKKAPIQAPGAGLSRVAIQRTGRIKMGEVAERVETRPAVPWARAKRRKLIPMAIPTVPLTGNYNCR